MEDTKRTAHGTHLSYWLDSSAGREFPPLTSDLDVEVLVVGGGIVGVTCARLLADRGVEVAVMDMQRVAGGVTGFSTAKLSAAQGIVYRELRQKHGAETASAYAAANQEAIEQIASWVETDGIECDFRRAAHVVYGTGPEDASQLQEETRAAEEAGLPAKFVTETELPFAVSGALRVPNQAQFHPVRYVDHLARDLANRGVAVHQQTRALSVDDGERIEVDTTGGTVRCRYLVLATNYPFLDRGFFFPRVHPTASYAITATIGAAAAPEDMYISASSPTRSIRSIPTGDGTLLLVGGEGHHVGEKPATEEPYESLREWTARHFGTNEITHMWSTHDGVPVDGIPYAGAIRPGSGRIFVATGFKKWGLTNGTAAAGVIADAITGRTSRFASLYDPYRGNLKAAGKKFVSENVRVASRFFLDRLRHPQGGDFDDLAPGEAAVGGNPLSPTAAYRDDAGALHRVSATCTHMGCLVRWNSAERTWDCPCHGSRFDTTGDVLHGPATRPLERRDADD
jgi:glycine/D-amino acid oxidase-like deaminating enzyme/nitrite reductase/ring-hydroxylating ferredoxin subunit